MNSLLVLHLEFLQVDVTRGFRCLSRTREQQHAFNCPCAGLWMPVIPYRDAVGFARFSDLIFCRISSSWAHGYFPVGRADLRVSRTLEMDPNFSSVQKISFYIVSYFLPNLACSRPLGTHTHTHVHIRTHIIHCCRYQLSLLPKPADFPALLEQGKAFSNTGIGGVLERFPRLWDSDLAYDSWQLNPNWVSLVQEGTNAANVLQISNGKVQQVLNHTPLNPTSFPAYCTVSRHAHA